MLVKNWNVYFLHSFIYFYVNLICTFKAINILLCGTALCKTDVLNKYIGRFLLVPSHEGPFSPSQEYFFLFCYTYIMIYHR